jgi:hypothetical protein
MTAFAVAWLVVSLLVLGALCSPRVRKWLDG